MYNLIFQDDSYEILEIIEHFSKYFSYHSLMCKYNSSPKKHVVLVTRFCKKLQTRIRLDFFMYCSYNNCNIYSGSVIEIIFFIMAPVEWVLSTISSEYGNRSSLQTMFRSDYYMMDEVQKPSYTLSEIYFFRFG